jgi:hypothetical protein
MGSTRVDDLWVETATGISVPTLLKRQVEPAAMEKFSSSLADRSELKFAACLRADLVAAVVAVRSLDDANLERLATMPRRDPGRAH